MIKLFITMEIRGKKLGQGILISNLPDKGKYMDDKRIEGIKNFMKINFRNALAVMYQQIDGLSKEESVKQSRKIAHELMS